MGEGKGCAVRCHQRRIVMIFMVCVRGHDDKCTQKAEGTGGVRCAD
jgi:hypothetical protein